MDTVSPRVSRPVHAAVVSIILVVLASVALFLLGAVVLDLGSPDHLRELEPRLGPFRWHPVSSRLA